MAIWKLDGFDHLPNLSGTALRPYIEADGWYGNTDSCGLITGRFGKGYAFGISNGFNYEVISCAIGRRYTTETAYVGQAFYLPANGGGQYLGFVDSKGGGGVQVSLYWDANGVLRVYRGQPPQTGFGGLIATSDAKAWHSEQFQFVEIKCLIHPTAGVFEVRVNTVVVISYLGNTQVGTPVLSLAPGWDALTYGKIGTGISEIYWDDRYISDNTGTVNTSYLGNARVNAQLVTGAGDLTQFAVTGAATNWQAVLAGVLDDTKYVSSPTAGQEDLYLMTANVAANQIFGIQVRGVYRQDDSTQMKARNIIKTGGTIYEGGDKFLSATYTNYWDTWDLNPFTGVGFTSANLNAIQAGSKVQP